MIAAEAERASIKYKMVEFMQDKIGQFFDGHISGMSDWGMYVELDETHIEGMVSLREMEDDLYQFDENRYEVYGRRKGRIFTLGDAVRIRVKRCGGRLPRERRKGACSDSGTPPKHVPTG